MRKGKNATTDNATTSDATNEALRSITANVRKMKRAAKIGDAVTERQAINNAIRQFRALLETP